MIQTTPIPSRIISRAYRTLAAYAATELLESHPEAGAGFRSDPMAVWQDWLGDRLKELAASVTAEEPSVFTRQVQWASAMLTARGFAAEHIRLSLESLRRVVESELSQSVRELPACYLDHALASLDQAPSFSHSRLQHGGSHGRLATEYLLALFQGDRRRASRLIFDALEDGDSVEDLISSVLMPAQVEIGRMWHADEINVAEEHFVSTSTRSIMAQLVSRAQILPSNGKTILAAGVAGNHIDIGLQAVGDFFEIDGWRVIQLGSDVPSYDIVQAVEYFESDLVGLSVSQSTQLETARRTIEALRSVDRVAVPKIIVGGFAFAGSEPLARKIGADGYASGPEEAVEMGRELVFGSADSRHVER